MKRKPRPNPLRYDPTQTLNLRSEFVRKLLANYDPSEARIPSGESGGGEWTSGGAGGSAGSSKEADIHSGAFKKWFGDWSKPQKPGLLSKVVSALTGRPKPVTPVEPSHVTDDKGRPLVVYHGTKANFSAFDKNRQNDRALMGPGFYFSESEQSSKEWGGGNVMGGSQGKGPVHVLPVYLNIKRPFDADAHTKNFLQNPGLAKFGYEFISSALGGNKKATAKLRKLGFDGITHMGKDASGKPARVWIAFDPNQIKSAHNQGTFDPSQENIYNFNPEEARDYHGRWTNGGTLGESEPLVGLPKTAKIKGIGEVPVGPSAHIRHVAAQYMKDHGLEYSPPTTYVTEGAGDTETTSIPIKSLKLDQANYDLAKSDVKRGLLSQTPGPVKVYRRAGQKELELGDGYHRLVEAEGKGQTHIEAKLAPEILPKHVSATTVGTLHSLFDRVAKPDGGFTYQLGTGREPSRGYAVSPYPERSFAKGMKELKPVDLARYLKKNHDLLSQPDHYLGAWHDPQSHKVFLDVSVVKSEEAAARQLALEKDQLAYFDLQTFKSVEVNPNATSGGVHNVHLHQAQTDSDRYQGTDLGRTTANVHSSDGPGANARGNGRSQKGTGGSFANNALWTNYLGAAYVKGVQKAYDLARRARDTQGSVEAAAQIGFIGASAEFTQNVARQSGHVTVNALSRLYQSYPKHLTGAAARVGVIHAHQAGQLDAYRALGVGTVKPIPARGTTCHNARRVYTVELLHNERAHDPHCRCLWQPVQFQAKKSALESFSDLLANYDPNQPRDRSGRWSKESGDVRIAGPIDPIARREAVVPNPKRDMTKVPMAFKTRKHGEETKEREEWDKIADRQPAGEKPSEWHSRSDRGESPELRLVDKVTHPPTRGDDSNTQAVHLDKHGDKPEAPKVEDVPRIPGTESIATAKVVHDSYLGGGINGSYKVTLDNGVEGVLKPASAEEDGLRDGIDGGTMYRREAAAYAVAKICGFEDLVPPTCIRDLPDHGGLGSLQKFVPGAKNARSVRYADKYDGRTDCIRAACFDYLTGNVDRHDNNWMLTHGNKLVLIDNGLSFPAVKSRGFSNQDLLEEMKVPTHSFGGNNTYNDWLTVPYEMTKLTGKWPEVEKALKEHGIEPEAIKLTKERLDILAKAGERGKPFTDLPAFYGQNIGPVHTSASGERPSSSESDAGLYSDEVDINKPGTAGAFKRHPKSNHDASGFERMFGDKKE